MTLLPQIDTVFLREWSVSRSFAENQTFVRTPALCCLSWFRLGYYYVLHPLNVFYTARNIWSDHDTWGSYSGFAG